MGEIKYHRTHLPVELGDIVETRIFFVKRRGKVVYVPGLSVPRKTLEYNELSWVGVEEDRGSFFASVVDPTTKLFDRKVRFVERGAPRGFPGKDPFIEPDEELDDFGVSKPDRER